MIFTHRAKADFCYFITIKVMVGNLIIIIFVGNLSILANTSLS